jgi:hypothetical protein
MESRSYKRSWKNLLINKRYQLRFTLFMVVLCAVLMAALGWWVMRVTDDTLQVAYNRLLGNVCDDPKLFADPDRPQDAFSPPKDTMPPPSEQAAPTAPAPAPAPPAATPPAAAGSAAAPAAGSAVDDEEAAAAKRRAAIRNSVQSEMKMYEPLVAKHFGKGIVEKWTCKMKHASAKERLDAGRMRILYVLIVVGIVLVIFLAGYGIKMTHKVAGPLFKVGLYHAKMREGRFDKVYNLRKGDQLVSFYEHFKAAHAGVVTSEQADIKQLKAVIAAAEAAGVGDDPTVAELRELVARKEKSLA